MPITFHIDHERKLITARITGTLTRADALKYQRDAWSSPDVRAYDELIDTSGMKGVNIPFPSGDAMRELAALSAGMDAPDTPTRFAIVAPGTFAYGLARMYATYRALDRRSTRRVNVFRSIEEATAWLEKGAEKNA
ncbi:MAG TPA: hypothetical protein VFH88_05880 [Candidatus Krumholzibacteria bacterium]|nr:hypothetical protein [Candidatus Krumholzibacteria bacterium]